MNDVYEVQKKESVSRFLKNWHNHRSYQSRRQTLSSPSLLLPSRPPPHSLLTCALLCLNFLFALFCVVLRIHCLAHAENTVYC